MATSRLEEFYDEISKDLDRCMEFWLKYSHDEQYGGFLTCLGPTGKCYDETKYVWFQGRQVWMYCRLNNEEPSYRKPEILEAAIKGAEFMMKYGKDPKTNRCYVSLTRDGQPIKMQRGVFSECFYVLGVSELARATGESKYKEEAITMMDKLIYWIREDSTDVRLGLPPLPGVTSSNNMAVPMMLLCILDQMETMDTKMADKYRDIGSWSLEQALAHVQRDGSVVLDNVSLSGEELPGCMGRMMIPGHAIEAGWFLLQYANKRSLDDVKKTAIEKFIRNPFEYGWDSKHGGLYYYLDADGISPVQLEWNMKLWWPHNETLIAFLMAYMETKEEDLLDKFATVFDYCYTKFVDRDTGEWVGYLNRDGTVSMDFKGGPWKGCFHVPRALLYCKQMLAKLLNK